MKKKFPILKNLNNALITHKSPVYLIHFVTQRCNARCPHCFVDFKNGDNELTLEQIEKTASTTGGCLRNIALTGGEPFIRNDLFEIADIWYTNSTIQTISITTNGSMPQKIEDFALKAVKKDIPVSFFFSYNYIGEKHSSYRNLKDLHLNVIESYKIIKSFKNKLNGTFQITVNPDNYDSAFETYKYMRDVLNIQNINCTMIRGEKAECLTPMRRDNIAAAYKQIAVQRDNDFDTGFISGFTDKSLTSLLLNAKNKMLWKYVLKTFNEKKYISPCHAGSLFGIIYANGDVAPCELLNKKEGNLKDYDFNLLKCLHNIEAEKIKKEILCSKCHCTFECSWLINIFSSPRYYGELVYHILKNILRK